MSRPLKQPAVHDSPQGAVLTVHIQPGAKRTEYAGLHGEALKFRVAAPPVEGAANDALRAHLAKRFDLPKQAVLLQAGHGSRRKQVLLRGVSAQRVRDELARTGSGQERQT